MKGRMKWFWFAIIVYFFFTLPLLIANVLSVDWFGFAPGKADAWIGFWGSYLGGVVGLVGVVATTFYIVHKNNVIKDEELREIQRQHDEQMQSMKRAEDENFRINELRGLEKLVSRVGNLSEAYYDIREKIIKTEAQYLSFLKDNLSSRQNNMVLLVSTVKDFLKAVTEHNDNEAIVKSELLFVLYDIEIEGMFLDVESTEIIHEIKETIESVEKSEYTLNVLAYGQIDKVTIKETLEKLLENVEKLEKKREEIKKLIERLLRAVKFAKYGKFVTTSQLEDDER